MSPSRTEQPRHYIVRGSVYREHPQAKENVALDTILQTDWRPENHGYQLLTSVRIVGQDKRQRQLLAMHPYLRPSTTGYRSDTEKPRDFIAVFPAKAGLEKVEVLLHNQIIATYDRARKPRGQMHAQASRSGVRLAIMADCDRIEVRAVAQTRGGLETRQIFVRDSGELSVNQQILIPWENLPLAEKVRFEAHIQRGLNYIKAVTPLVRVVKQAVKTRLYCTGMMLTGHRQIRVRGAQRARKVPVYQLTLLVKARLHGQDLPDDAVKTVIQGKTYTGRRFQAECQGQAKVPVNLKMQLSGVEFKQARQTLDLAKLKRIYFKK
ncbi:hypothetical protein K8S19_06975 [bacterium]|nr:hypothetical protein [bacterium]